MLTSAIAALRSLYSAVSRNYTDLPGVPQKPFSYMRISIDGLCDCHQALLAPLERPYHLVTAVMHCRCQATEFKRLGTDYTFDEKALIALPLPCLGILNIHQGAEVYKVLACRLGSAAFDFANPPAIVLQLPNNSTNTSAGALDRRQRLPLGGSLAEEWAAYTLISKDTGGFLISAGNCADKLPHPPKTYGCFGFLCPVI